LATWKAISFDRLDGWAADDHLAAFSCFRISARALVSSRPEARVAVPPSGELIEVARKALDLDPKKMSSLLAREFFESHFKPHTLDDSDGFVTAYFEPEVTASRTQTQAFPYPLLRRPKDLVKIRNDNRPENWPDHLEYARETGEGLVEFFNREEIDKGALSNRSLELFWLKSAIEAFYIHVQGSARLLFDDGSSARVSYAGKTGHPYTSIGKLLVARGVLSIEEANMTNIRAWLEADHDRAFEVLHKNQSYIFFTELEGHDPDFGPIAAAGVQLTPGRSLAVDRNIHAYGTPVWISTHQPLPMDTTLFRRLMIAQDTGSAIVGPQRGDIFIGSGAEAGMIAGAVRHDTEFVVLQPETG